MMLTAVQLIQQLIMDVTDVPVVSKTPAERPELFVIVDQAAPVRITPVEDRVLVIVQVQGRDLVEVIALSQHLHESLLYATHTYMLGWDSTTGPHEFSDPDVPDEPRWQFTGTLYQALT